MFKTGDVMVCTAALFEDPVVSSVARLFRSVLLGNHPPALFVARLFLVGYFALLGFSP
jgi:hypothetical protein